MHYFSDDVYDACDCCLHAKSGRKGWYCKRHEDDYFPEAPWDGPDEYEPTSCPSFKPDPDCYDPEDWIW